MYVTERFDMKIHFTRTERSGSTRDYVLSPQMNSASMKPRTHNNINITSAEDSKVTLMFPASVS